MGVGAGGFSVVVSGKDKRQSSFTLYYGTGSEGDIRCSFPARG